jgi:hypothetical protein
MGLGLFWGSGGGGGGGGVGLGTARTARTANQSSD